MSPRHPLDRKEGEMIRDKLGITALTDDEPKGKPSPPRCDACGFCHGAGYPCLTVRILAPGVEGGEIRPAWTRSGAGGRKALAVAAETRETRREAKARQRSRAAASEGGREQPKGGDGATGNR